MLVTFLTIMRVMLMSVFSVLLAVFEDLILQLTVIYINLVSMLVLLVSDYFFVNSITMRLVFFNSFMLMILSGNLLTEKQVCTGKK